ncbi:MAG: SPFH domain-containing protein [Elusimicrobia bacterium]|nr:SPFH domain-containing protein [Elusimicrobiota bacterium]
MALIGYFKGDPNEHLLVYSGDRLRREGPGLAFFYWAPSTSIISIPTGTVDAQFILNETTGNFQAVTVQGQITFRIAQPKTLAAVLNFTIDPKTRAYRSTDPDKLAQRIVNVVQAGARAELLKMSLEDALKRSDQTAAAVLAKTKADPTLAEMGVQVVSVYFNSVRPTPEMAKALEAEYREGLQVKADQAIYNRRALAVEQERKIKENEVNTQVALEEKRQGLVSLQGENDKKQAEFEAAATEIRLKPYKSIEPRSLVAMGLKEMGENAEKIGTLTITPELVASLLQK